MSNFQSYEFQQFILEKISEFLPPTFKRVGNKFNGRCPLCGDSHKSSTKKRGWIYPDGSYYCFNCGTGMSGIKFLEVVSGDSYASIKREYAKLFLKSGLSMSLSSTYEIPSSEPSIFQLKSVINPSWKNELSDKAKKYLDDRLVSRAPFLKEPLYSCYSDKTKEEFILIPWKLNGVDAYYQVNDFQKLHDMKYIFPKNSKKLIYGLDNVDVSWPYIIVFEGAYDSMFVKNGIAVGTKAITDYQLKLIRERFPHHQIVISFDNDSSGIESMRRLVKSSDDFKFFKWFNSNTRAKDINEYILQRNDVNTFTDPSVLEKLIIDKLKMKMFLVQNGYWKVEKALKNGPSSSRETWKIRERLNRILSST